MLRNLMNFWQDDDGYVVSSELVMYGTMGVIGVGAGYTAVRDTINSELNDVAKALGSMDQSYYFSGVSGHSAWTAGSAFFDRADRCDVPPLQQVVVHPNCDRPLVCADVFGRDGREYHPHHHPHPAPHAHPAAVVPPLSGTTAPVAGPVLREYSSKCVVIDEPGPAVVVGAPGPAPVIDGQSHHQHPHHGPAPAEPYVVDVPEGYFHSMPPSGYIGPASQYPGYLQHRYGYFGPGYHYTPVAAPLVDAPAILHVEHAAPPHHGEPRKPGWNTIDLGFTKVGDDELKQVEKFRTAKCLHVLGSNVTDKGMVYVGELEQLESLHLIGTQISDDGLAEIAGLKNLRFLHLVGTKITDAGLKHLVGLKRLEELDVRGTPVTDEGLDRLRKALPTLRVIR